MATDGLDWGKKVFRFPDLLASRRGRLAAFFFLYVTEGIPSGFAAVTVTSQLRRMDIGPAEIGAIVAAAYVPWTVKWAMGPLVDALRSKRFGHRRAWILLAQLMMAITLLMLAAIPLPAQLELFAVALVAHNVFGALQSVAIGGLAVNALHADERGVANGLMFAGATLGTALGGGGVLLLIDHIGLQSSFIVIVVAMLAVSASIVLPLREPLVEGSDGAAPPKGGGVASALAEMRTFVSDAFHSFTSTRGAFAGIFFMLLPLGALSLGLTLHTNLAVELGFSNRQLGALELASVVVTLPATVVGGWLSDRFGRRLMLTIYCAALSAPVLWLMTQLQAHGYVMPHKSSGVVDEALVRALWISILAYSAAGGLLLGTRMAIIMDVITPRVASTQLAAYTSLMNLAIAFSVTWQGQAVEALGYPTTLAIDAVFGLANLLVLPMLKPTPVVQFERGDGGAASRMRLSAGILAVICLSWLPFSHFSEAFGASRRVVGTLFTIVFIASALVLYVENLQGGRGARLKRWLAFGSLAMYVRYFVNSTSHAMGWEMQTTEHIASVLFDGVALLVGLTLAAMAWRRVGSGASDDDRSGSARTPASYRSSEVSDVA